jgi:hypothetical protein
MLDRSADPKRGSNRPLLSVLAFLVASSAASAHAGPIISAPFDIVPVPNVVPEPGNNPAIGAGPNGFLVGWPGATGMHLATVGSNGKVAFPATLLPGIGSNSAPSIVFAGGVFLVAWTGSSGSQGALFDTKGGVVKPPFSLVPTGTLPPLVSSDGAQFLVLHDGKAVVVSPTGDVSPAFAAPLPPGEAAVTFGGGCHLVVAWDDPSSALRAQRFAVDGTPLDVAPFFVATPPKPTLNSSRRIAVAFDGTAFVVATVGDSGVSAIRVPPDGAPPGPLVALSTEVLI